MASNSTVYSPLPVSNTATSGSSCAGGNGGSYQPVATAPASCSIPVTSVSSGNSSLKANGSGSVSKISNRSWCDNRTRLEKYLLGALVVVCLVASVVVVAVVIATTAQNGRSSSLQQSDASSQQGSTQSSSSVCITPDCVKAAARMLEAMDPDVDRCADFYGYACGTWNRVHVIPSDRPNYNAFHKMSDDLQAKLKALFEEPVNEKVDPQAVINVKHLYKSCLNTELIEQRGEEPLIALIRNLGGWPLIESTEFGSTDFDLVNVIARMRLINHRVLMNLWVNADDKNSSVNSIHIDQPKLGLPSRDYFLKGRGEKAFVAYEKFMRSLAVSLGANATTVQQDVDDVLQFEVDLANLTTPEDRRRDHELLYHQFTVGELYRNLTSAIDWLKFLRLIFSEVNVNIDLSEPVIVYAPNYITQLGKLITRTPNRTLANYIMWQLAMNRVAFLPQRFNDLRNDLKKALTGTDQDRSRWQICVNYVNENFGMAVGKMFIAEHFDENAKSQALAMIADIRAAFNELLQEIPWIDESTRQVARAKAAAMQENIGYPDYILNTTALNADYQNVRIESGRYFENSLNIFNAATKTAFQQLRLSVDKTKWSTTPAIVNAFYSSTKNQIMFPAGILQPPFYHENYPKFLNYGGIGMVIGHEITHGFDDMGRQFDLNGNLKQWWSSEVVEKFKARARCIVDQYSNFTIAEVKLNLNGQQTQGENIADNGGLKQAFRAYRRWVEAHGHEEPRLPGLNLTGNQLFFLNFAQIWCGTARPENYIQSVRTERHSPGRFRVIGPLSNSIEFADAFGCPLGSPMNPRSKCQVW